MVSNEDLFKREEDRKWRERVDERIVSLTTDATVIHDRLDTIDENLDGLDRLMRGDPQTDRAGFDSRLHDVEVTARELRAVLIGDYTGKAGLVHDVNFLMDRKRAKMAEKTVMRPAQVALLGTLTAAVIAATTAMIVNWNAVKNLFFSKKPDVLGQMVNDAKHPKGRHYHYKIVVPAPDDDDSN